MESDSDSSNNGSERNDSESEEEESESDDDSFVSQGGTHYGWLEPRSQYTQLMKRLRTGHSCLMVWDRRVLDLIFASMDKFCEAVSNIEGIKSIDIGDVQGDDAEGPKLEIAEENASNWNKLFRTLSNLSSVEEIVIGGYSLSGSLMTRLVDGVPQANVIKVYLPWYTLDGEDLRPFVQYLLDHPSKQVDPLCFAGGDNGNTQEGLFDGTKNHFLADGGLVANLVRLASRVSFDHIKFTLEECQKLARLLSSEECKMKEIWLEDCNFADYGGKLVASSFANNKSLKSIRLSDLIDDNTFYDEVIATLPLNSFIEVVYIGRSRLDVAVGLLKNIARQNKTVKKIIFNSQSFTFNENDVQMLRRELRHNHTLESIRINQKEQFRVITRLNEAGRCYLSEDSTSNSKYIAVLAKVKNDLDCLYCHLRENPILFMSYYNSVGRQSGKKRKARDTV